MGFRRDAPESADSMPDFHVTPSPDALWEVKTADTGEVVSRHNTREQAEIAARQLVSERGGGEVRIHDASGEVTERESLD